MVAFKCGISLWVIWIYLAVRNVSFSSMVESKYIWNVLNNLEIFYLECYIDESALNVEVELVCSALDELTK